MENTIDIMTGQTLTVQESTVPLIEMGRYPGTINQVGVVKSQFQNDDGSDQFNLVWRIALDIWEGADREIWGYTYLPVTPRNNSGEWLTALGLSIAPDATIETDDLAGRRVVAEVIQYTPKKGANAGQVKNKIIGLKPEGAAQPAANGNGTAKPF